MKSGVSGALRGRDLLEAAMLFASAAVVI